jgi:MFS family permease
VAPNCVPTLLGLTIGSAAGKAAALYWTGLLTSVLLLGWALGGVAFGYVCDRIGRLRMLMLTMLLYAIGTAACATASSIWMLLLFRLVAAIGIGGEWVAGAAMVAEIVPEKRRVEAGALLYTAAPMGLFLATFLNHQVAGVWLATMPAKSWRYVFLLGPVPAAVAFVVRLFVRELKRWQAVHVRTVASWRELFGPQFRRRTFWGTFVAVVALVMWWCGNAFLPTLCTGLAREAAAAAGLAQSATLALVEEWKRTATNIFNLGGLIGTLLALPIATRFGRRPLFAIYFAVSAAAILATFGLPLDAQTRIRMFFLIVLSVFGVFGAFTYCLPELFPTRLRASGAGSSYNIGRVLASVGPFLVGAAAARGVALQVIFYVGFVPLFALLLAPFYIETRGQSLSD